MYNLSPSPTGGIRKGGSDQQTNSNYLLYVYSDQFKFKFNYIKYQIKFKFRPTTNPNSNDPTKGDPKRGVRPANQLNVTFESLQSVNSFSYL